jgi:hypothetical protein
MGHLIPAGTGFPGHREIKLSNSANRSVRR